MRGTHEAPVHTDTIFTDNPKDQFTQQWEREHPDRIIKWSRVKGSGVIEIGFTKKSEEEAARLANEQEPKKIGTLDARGNFQAVED